MKNGGKNKSVAFIILVRVISKTVADTDHTVLALCACMTCLC